MSTKNYCEAVRTRARNLSTRRIPGLRRAQAKLLSEGGFGVKTHPEDPGCATLGSKEGFANMAQAITAPG